MPTLLDSTYVEEYTLDTELSPMFIRFYPNKRKPLIHSEVQEALPDSFFFSFNLVSPPRWSITYTVLTETFLTQHETVKAPFHRKWQDYNNLRPLQSSSDDLSPTTYPCHTE